jgi:hypothetical protein
MGRSYHSGRQYVAELLTLPTKHTRKRKAKVEAVEEEGDLALVKASACVLVLKFGTTEPNPDRVEGIASTSEGSVNPLGVEGVRIAPRVYQMLRGRLPKAFYQGGRPTGPHRARITQAEAPEGESKTTKVELDRTGVLRHCSKSGYVT